jgi:hypothetical protein
VIAPLLIALGSLLVAPPVAVIVGPERGNPGDLIVLDATQSRDAVGFAWVLADGDKTFLEVDNGRKVVFATGTAGRYTFVLIAANAQADGKPQVAVARHVLTVGEPQPNPNPPNPDPPGPQPNPLPPGKYGLASFARDAAAGVQLVAAERARTAVALAGSFDSIASTIAAGAIKTPADAIGATQANNITALGSARDAWRPWAEALRVKLNTLSDSGQMSSMDDYIVAWREISTGLRAVK